MAMIVNEKLVRDRMYDLRINSLEELARRSDVTSLSIRKLFKGGAFTSETLEKLARALECHPYDLLTVEGYPAPQPEAQVGVPA